MSSANNPQIAVITHMEKKIIDSLDDAEYLKSLRQIFTMANLIKDEHRDKEFLDKIRDEYVFLANTKNPDKVKTHGENNLFKYILWFGEITEKLYSEKYFIDQGYGSATLADLQNPEGWDEE